MKNVHMCIIGITEGKIETLNKEGNLNFYLHDTLFLPEGVHKIS